MDNKTTDIKKGMASQVTSKKKGEDFAKKSQELKDLYPFISKNDLKIQDVYHIGFVLKNLWGEEDIAIPLNKNGNSFLSKLSNIYLPKFLVAIYHEDIEEYEFIYQPLDKQDKYARYKFDFIYDGKKFSARFDNPSEEFKTIATHTYCSNEENERSHRNIPQYFKYYSKDSSTLPDIMRLRLDLIYHNKIAVNFFIKGDFKNLSEEKQITLFQHLNIVLFYNDRKSPQIIIIQDNNDIEPYPIPRCVDKSALPANLNIKKLQDNLLDLLITARNAPTSRLQYLYYFQVIEFCTYYFLTADIKRKIQDILEDPSLLSQTDQHTQKLINIIQDDYYNRHSEDDRLKCMFREYCSYDDIKEEIDQNFKYFEKDIEFKGGYVVKKLFKEYSKINNNPDNVPSIMDNIYNNIIKIRNVLVHARESHQNTSISPNIDNENLLKPYLYIVQRMAEVISRKFS